MYLWSASINTFEQILEKQNYGVRYFPVTYCHFVPHSSMLPSVIKRLYISNIK